MGKDFLIDPFKVLSTVANTDSISSIGLKKKLYFFLFSDYKKYVINFKTCLDKLKCFSFYFIRDNEEMCRWFYVVSFITFLQPTVKNEAVNVLKSNSSLL